MATYYVRNGGKAEYMDAYQAALRNDEEGCKEKAKDIIKLNSSHDISATCTRLKGEFKTKIITDKDDKLYNKGGMMLFFLEEDKVPKDDVITILASLMNAMFVAGGFIGGFFSAKIADSFGRKTGMMMISPMIMVSAAMGTVKDIPELLIASRFIGGLHSGLCIAMNSLYLTEISPNNIRGSIGVLFQLFITVGILMTQIAGLPEILGHRDRYPYIFTFMLIPSFVSVVILIGCPESPSYTLSNRDDEETALTALKAIRGTDDVGAEIDAMVEENVKSKEKSDIKSYTLCELLRAKELRFCVIIACFIMVAQQWSGVNAVFGYSKIMFDQAGITTNYIPYAIVLTGIVNVSMTVVAVPLLDMVGRRPLLIFPTILALLAFVVMTIMLILIRDLPKDDIDSKETYGIICIVCMMTYIVGFAVGLGPIPFIVVGEIFRNEPRAAAMSIALVFNWSCNFILTMFYPIMEKVIKEYANIPFIVIMILSVIFFVMYIPETKNKSIDEISKMLGIKEVPTEAKRQSEEGMVTTLSTGSGKTTESGSGRGN